MAWTPYKLADGSRIPSVTTVIGRFKESGALIHWAWKLGTEGKDYNAVKDAAADAGTCAHVMIEAYIKGVPFVREGWGAETLAKGETAFGAFQLWANGTSLVPIASEARLISENMRIGGTIDCVGRTDGRMSIIDWKTGGLYADHLYQVAAYAMLWDEAHPDQPITGGYHLCRFNRESGDFSHSYFGELDAAKRGFLLMRDLYQLDQSVKKRVK